MFQVFAATPERMGPDEIGNYAARAESMGFDGLQVPDAIHDGLLLSAMALAATRELIVGTGVLVAFPRSPMTVAVASWDLQRMSGGRFELGVGTQIRQNIEDRYSARWGSPVPQLREYIQSLQAIFHSFQTGDKLNFTGEHYRFTRLQPFFNPGPIDHPNIPILAGAIGPAMTRMVGRVADGMITHPTNSPPRYIREICLPRVRAGLESAGREGKDFRLIVGPLTATGRDEQSVMQEWERMRSLLAFLYSTPAYWPSLELFGWKDKGRELQEMARAGHWDKMTAILNDSMLEQFVPRGTYDEIDTVYRDRYGELSARITFPMPADPVNDDYAAEAVARLKS
ncbi:MAG: TIGR03617 family F420-dependent LLM class oxidoreductase [Halioglobus sp.]|nr:TIGR03617 family F420-dependent LLM class oxidoreductase [Halioglobus sp.]